MGIDVYYLSLLDAMMVAFLLYSNKIYMPPGIVTDCQAA